MGCYNVQLHLDKNPCLQIKECKINDSVFLFSSKMYVVGTQKNHLSERFYFYLRRFSESRSSSGSTRLVCPSPRLSARPKHFRVPSLCNL